MPRHSARPCFGLAVCRWVKCSQSGVCVVAFVRGAPLGEILEAGEWSSPAFLKYLDLHRLDAELVVQAHAGESDSEDDA